ncbi:MAG: nitronate monooxygenase [Chloroflexi bacterium]|nr:nitronate monooxygenase [Chloroflexota bacterium]
MLKTRITELFGIEYPIIGGAMLWLSRAPLTAAISNAGGLGILSALTFETLPDLREEIRKTKSLTKKPFAVNVTLMPTVRQVNYEEVLNAIVEEGVPVIETAGRPPEAAWIKRIKDAGVKMMHKVAAVRHAVSVERAGMDAVSIISFEAGGHPGMLDVTSMVQIPLAANAVKIPVIGGGGIADSRGVVAVLALGAEGVLMGTRFMASQESGLHPKIKEWLIRASETDTMMIMRSINNAARVARTDYNQKILNMEQSGATLEQILPLISGKLGCTAMLETGDISSGVVYCGQAVGLIRDVPTCQEIMDSLIGGVPAVGQRLRSIGVA